jgi:hypothetical protein
VLQGWTDRAAAEKAALPSPEAVALAQKVQAAIAEEERKKKSGGAHHHHR